jgi:hypothetical protein
MKMLSYVVSVQKKDGAIVFLRKMANSTKRTATNTGLTSDPAAARNFDMDVDKAVVLEWMDSERIHVARYADADTMKIMVFERTLSPVADDDIEWRTSLQRSGVNKLSRLEIEALGLEKYEIERRLSK